MNNSYEILVREWLGEEWQEWFAPLQLSHPAEGGTRLTGEIADQAALHGLLALLRDRNLTIISINPLARQPACQPNPN